MRPFNLSLEELFEVLQKSTKVEVRTVDFKGEDVVY